MALKIKIYNGNINRFNWDTINWLNDQPLNLGKTRFKIYVNNKMTKSEIILNHISQKWNFIESSAQLYMKATELASMFVSVCLSVYLHTGVCLAAVLNGSVKIFVCFQSGKQLKSSVFLAQIGGKFPLKLCLHSGEAGDSSFPMPTHHRLPH